MVITDRSSYFTQGLYLLLTGGTNHSLLNFSKAKEMIIDFRNQSTEPGLITIEQMER